MKFATPHLYIIIAAAICFGHCSMLGAAFEDIHGFTPQFRPPPQVNLVNVRDLGAVGDGVTDDTEVFRRVIEQDQPRGIYLPAGTYLVRDSLIYGVKSNKKKRVCLIGENSETTIIRLADRSHGFGDPVQPKVFIATRPPRQQGEQNMHQFLYHLTIEIGKGNPGAIALNYHSNNTGAIKDVCIRASDPHKHPGLIGLACMDWEVGPASAYYLSVEGFQTGISLTKVGNYFTMENITVKNCDIGVLVSDTVSIHKLHTIGCRLPVQNKGRLVLLNSLFDGQGEVGVEHSGDSLFARRLQAPGYAQLVSRQGSSVAGSSDREYTSEGVKINWPDQPAASLDLPVRLSPEIPYPEETNEWVVMPGRGDISQALQDAIDSGAKHIAIPGGGGQKITQTILLRNKVQRIMGMGVATVRCDTGDKPVFILKDGDSPEVLLELFYGAYGSKYSVGVLQESPRTMIIRFSGFSYRTAPSGRGGKVFIESLVGHAAFHRVHAWVRDLDTEAGGPKARNVVNEGSVLWLLGHKTEDFATKIKTTEGGFTELLGGTYRQNWDLKDFQRAGLEADNPPSLFEVIDSHVSLSYHSWGPAIPYRELVRETRLHHSRSLLREDHGGSAALFSGYTQRIKHHPQNNAALPQDPNGPRVTNRWGEVKSNRIPVEETVVFKGISGYAYNHHPQITSSESRLLATWSSGIWNEDEPGQVMLLSISEDQGQTWSAPKPIFDKKAGLYNDVVYTSEGIHAFGNKLVAFCGVYDYAAPLEVKQDLVFPKPKAGETKLPYQKVLTTNHATLIKTSEDGGQTWSPATKILDRFIPNLSPVRLTSGRLILPGNVSLPYTDDPSGQSGWTHAGLPRLPEGYIDAPRWYQQACNVRGDTTGYGEATVIELPNKNLRAFFRTNDQRLATAISRDQGQTWSEPQWTQYTDCKSRLHFGRLPDGRYFGLTCPKPRSVRTPLILATSRDGLVFDQHYLIGDAPWKEARISGRWKYGRYGYPYLLVKGDQAYAIYSINKEDIAVSRFSLNAIKDKFRIVHVCELCIHN